jgi:hypothetical protein
LNLVWDGDRVTVGGTAFRIGSGLGAQPGPDELLLMKPRWMVDRYVELVGALRPKRIFEMGIYFGGSVAFLAMLAEPDRYVATDLRESSSAAFDAWNKGHPEVRVYFGVDQGDPVALGGVVSDEFAREPLDLVIDDASHLLGPTRAAFNVLFPLLRPGGLYVIEDWSVAHGWERQIARDPAVARRVGAEAARRPEVEGRMPLTRLLFEIVLTCAYSDLVSEVQLGRDWLVVTRGPEPATVTGFDLRDCHLPLARRLLREEGESRD